MTTNTGLRLPFNGNKTLTGELAMFLTTEIEGASEELSELGAAFHLHAPIDGSLDHLFNARPVAEKHALLTRLANGLFYGRLPGGWTLTDELLIHGLIIEAVNRAGYHMLDRRNLRVELDDDSSDGVLFNTLIDVATELEPRASLVSKASKKFLRSFTEEKGSRTDWSMRFMNIAVYALWGGEFVPFHDAMWAELPEGTNREAVLSFMGEVIGRTGSYFRSPEITVPKDVTWLTIFPLSVREIEFGLKDEKEAITFGL